MQSFPVALLELVHDPAIVFEPESEIVLDVNARACELYGRTRDAFVGLSLRDISRDPLTGTHRIRETLAGEEAREFQTVQFGHDGRELVLSVRATPVEYEGRPAILSVNRQIAAEAAEWQLALDAVPAAILLVDDNARIVRANRRALAISGSDDLAQLTGRELAAAGKGEPWASAARLLRLAYENVMTLSGKVDDEATGRSWSVSVTLPPASTTRGVVVISDITAMVNLEAEVHRVEALAEFGQVVAGVAHEVRTPLFALATTIEVLEGSSLRSGDEKARRRFEMMRAQITRLNVLMHDLLEYGKAPALDVLLQPLDRSIVEAVRLNAAAARERAVEVRNEFPAGTPSLLLDEPRMVTALRNVVENAVQHAPSGSVVTIRGGLREGSGRVVCVIEDSGSGFPPQDLSSVMVPFFTRRTGGTGLGLAIVQRTVELHGGRVLAENRAEGGARVTIELPVAS